MNINLKYYEIIYLFKKDYNFTDFITDLYNMRLEYPPKKTNDPMNYIAKIIMNSLYGRFGMSDYFDEVLILGEKEYLKFEALSNKKVLKF